ncbi:hypothetical protein TNCV_1635061 [Trichonephila clavipes]|nr:hypothetical protein TNCV_1635061 [Trichonephila clavipes]
MVDRKLAIGQTGKRQLALSVRGERWLKRIVGIQRSQTVRITNQSNDGASRTVSKWTVQYLLHRIGLKKPSTYESTNAQSSPQGCTSCLAREHRYWSVENWQGVAWCDKSRF